MRLGVLALALVVAGCSLVPEFAPPAVPMPAAWEAAEGAAPATQWPSRDWWRGFGSLTLDALIAMAERNNTDIAAAAARVLQAEAQARVAGAPLWPSLDASADASREWQPGAGSSTSSRTTGVKTVTTKFDAGLSASYELDFFGKNRATLAAATWRSPRRC